MQCVVLGMYSSGTLPLTRILNLMGAYVGTEGALREATKDNPKGCWERNDVHTLHQEIFQTMGASWHELAHFDLDTLSEDHREAFAQKARVIVQNLDAHRPWVLKDPRMCLLLPLWRPLLEAPICIHIYRRPLQVAQSILTRNGLPLHCGVALWEKYNLAALANSRHLPRLFVSHDRLLAHPLETVRTLHKQLLALGVQGLHLPSERELLALLDPVRHREHGDASLEKEVLNFSQEALTQALEEGMTSFFDGALSLSVGAQAILESHECEEKRERQRVADLRALQQQLSEEEQDFATVRERLVALEDSKTVAETALRQQLIEGERLLAEKEQQIVVFANERQQYTRDRDQLLGWLGQLDRAFVSVVTSQRWKIGHTLASLYRKVRFKPPLPMPHDSVNKLREDLRVWKVTKNLVSQMERTPAVAAPAIRRPPKILTPGEMGPGEVRKKVIPEEMEPEKISVVILNRNGAEHLQNLFASVWAHNTYRNVEFLLVDHASSDQSRDVLRAWQSHLPLKITACDQNYSFSYSNNEAAKKADGQYVFFLNNDIIFDEDVLPLLLARFHAFEPEVGLLGVKLIYPPHHETAPYQVQHAGVKFSEDLPQQFYCPYEIGVKAHSFSENVWAELVPAVTGAALLCQRDEFLSIGGFCEEYFYGYEDVDLCLSYIARHKKVSRCVTDTRLIHDEGATRRLEGGEERSARILSNRGVLQKRYGYAIKKAVQMDIMQGASFWTSDVLVVAFAVTEAHEQAKAGDYFTAAELAFACAKQFGWQVKFLVRHQDWYDLTGVDVLIAMVDAYDLTQITQAKPTLVKIAWLRNWFERWGQQPCFDAYDIYLCSSQKGARFIQDHYGKQPHVFRLATNERRFMPGSERKEYHSDYCFTGSYWNAARDIESVLDPTRLEYQFALYGNGWDAHHKFRRYWKGFVPYKTLPFVYSSTKVAIDDANHVTKPWASVNSRVFDALASGTLVITNGEEGAKEVFDDKLPSYRDGGELHALLDRYLNDDAARQALVADLRQTVLNHHTYTHRAVQLQSLLVDWREKKFRITIKVPVPRMEVAQEWGDYHFALALRRAFVKHGHAVRIDILPDWDSPQGFGDDVVLVLRGLSQYVPKPEHINILWNISHPDQVQAQEYEQYDHVYIASHQYAEQLRTLVKVPVSPLLQCTDPALFYPDVANGIPINPILFVGNSRKQLRTIVKDAMAANIPLAIYGTLWDGLVPRRYVMGTHIENTELHRYYSTCKVLLNDHWPSMREQGFISNRLFDAGACGTLVVTDAVEGLEPVFGDAVVVYRDAADLKRVVDHFVKDEGARREKGERAREIVLRDHTFDHRAATILGMIAEIDRRKRFAAVGTTTAKQDIRHYRG